MKFKPKTNLEKFGAIILNLLVDNFSQSFFVGGYVRDLILKRKITDIDIASEARPEKIINILKKSKIQYDDKHKNFGIIIAKRGNSRIEIASFRKEAYKNSRYPKITFTKSLKLDSKRRDFTVNSLYYKPNFKLIDYYNGTKDLKRKIIRFIGNPRTKIGQDPLRIVRAIRFALILGFKINKRGLKIIKHNHRLTSSLTKKRLNNEIKKIGGTKFKAIFIECVNNKNSLDKYFYSSYN